MTSKKPIYNQEDIIKRANAFVKKTKLENEIKAQQKVIDKAKSDKKSYAEAKSYAVQQLQIYNPGDPEYAQYTADIALFTKYIGEENAKVKKAVEKLIQLNTDLLNLTPTPNISTKVTNVDYSTPIAKIDATKETKAYKYNAPMVKSAYLNSQGPQSESVRNSSSVGAPKQKDAKVGFWQGKGTIQASPYYINNTTLDTLTAKEKAALDTNLYGFRFLYNPQTVTMGWGVTTAVNPQLEMMGGDKSMPISGLNNTTVSFDLLLNRIEDMNLLYEYGFRPLSSGLSPAVMETPHYKGQQGIVYAKDSYPSVVSDSEAASIYKKGTMYDLEYLFKAINGHQASYNSYLNGSTADKGWLLAVPVELHLGSGLRYLVRINSLSVSHNMFDERMVPILTTVSMMCTRYYDGKEALPTNAKVVNKKK